MSYLSHLECSECARLYPINRLQTYCADCAAPLLARYDLLSARKNLEAKDLERRARGMWRWKEILPVEDPGHIVSLGEGDTPLLPVPRLASELGLPHLFVKEESVNPTGTFKARGLSAAISKAKELGASKFVIPTAGNAGGALAAYAAHGRLAARVYMPQDTPEANIQECRAAGAEVILVDGLINEAARQAGELSQSDDWFDVSTFKEPYRVEGKKIMGYELAEAFSWELPEVILYPTGGGTGLVGMWKAFEELEQLGWKNGKARPRMVAVQAEGCAPVVKSFENGVPTCEFWPEARTLAAGLRVPKPFADRLILRTLKESNGVAISVSDSAIQSAQKQLARMEGIFAAPEGAAALAALIQLAGNGWLNPGERIVIFNTGSGLKYI